jgi:hypothetical protein
MSDLQKLGRELDYFYEDVQELLPNYTKSIMHPLHQIFERIVESNTPPEEELDLINKLYSVIQDTQNEWRGLLSETFDKN